MLPKHHVSCAGRFNNGDMMHIELACVGCIDGRVDDIQTLTTSFYIGQS